MDAYFDAFLGRHYVDQEPITALLSKFGWYDTISTRIEYVILTDNPKYQTVVTGLIQPIQDVLRRMDNLNEKKRIEGELGKLFRNLIADLLQNKAGFHEEYPGIVGAIRDAYEVNGDDFEALDQLIGLSHFLNNLRLAVPIEESYGTRRLEWVHNTINLSVIDAHLKQYDLLSDDSNFEDLFRETTEPRSISVPVKKLKRFTILMGEFINLGWIKSKGGRATYHFIQKHMKVIGRDRALSKNYMRQTVDSYNSRGDGEKKHKDSIDGFLGEIEEKSRQ